MEFAVELHDRTTLQRGIDNKRFDFTGDVPPTAEYRRVYYMTRPIAHRTKKIFTATDKYAIVTEKDINSLRVAFLGGAMEADRVAKYYPDVTFHITAVSSAESAAAMLQSGEIDALVADGVMSPVLDQYGFIRSRKIFPLIYTPVSLATADPDLQPIITVFNKYIAAGGIGKLTELYKEGDDEYARYALHRYFTESERAYLDNLAANNITIKIAFDSDNYPISFYNKSEKIFQGIAVDVLSEIRKLTGMTFTIANDANTSVQAVLKMLQTGELSLVSQVPYAATRKDDFLLSHPYALAYYALLSKLDYPNLTSYQAANVKVGAIKQSPFEAMYKSLFPDNNNLIVYDTQKELLHALEHEKVDLIMGFSFLKPNFSEQLEFKLNIRFNTFFEQRFAFNKNEVMLSSIMNKAQLFVQTDTIIDYWTNYKYIFDKKAAAQDTSHFILIASILSIMLLVTSSSWIKSRRINRTLDKTVQERTREL
jgi:ABC-type amino acid transport substrate-binding protein